MTEQDKVTVDDIIGIVKTEEQTNSVEEVRKLRGRGNETAKRFIIMDNVPPGTHSNIWDKQKQHNQGIGDELWLGEVVAMLNEGVILAEENEQLRKDSTVLILANQDYRKENEQLKSSDTITDLETEIMNLKTTIQQLRTDNTKQKKKLNTIMKENEQLKKEIENLKQGLIHAAFDKEWK